CSAGAATSGTVGLGSMRATPLPLRQVCRAGAPRFARLQGLSKFCGPTSAQPAPLLSPDDVAEELAVPVSVMAQPAASRVVRVLRIGAARRPARGPAGVPTGRGGSRDGIRSRALGPVGALPGWAVSGRCYSPIPRGGPGHDDA